MADRAGDPVGYLDTDPINGRAAHWPDSWAQVRISSATDPRETAQLIAKNMRFEATERVRLPWRFTGLPAELTVGGLQVIEDEHTDTPWQTEIFFHGPDAKPDKDPWLIIRATEGPGTPPYDQPQPNTTVHGYPAQLVNNADGGVSLIVYRPDRIVHYVHVTPPGVLCSTSGSDRIGGQPRIARRPAHLDRPTIGGRLPSR